MYATPTGPEKVYLELQPKTRMKVDEVYENVVEDESATDVAVQRVNIGNTNQDGSNRRQAPPKKLNALRNDIRKIQRMQLLIVVAVVITFLTAVVSLVFIITIKWWFLGVADHQMTSPLDRFVFLTIIRFKFLFNLYKSSFRQTNAKFLSVCQYRQIHWQLLT